MSAPPKPWERPGVNNQNDNTTLAGQMSSPSVPDTLIPDVNRGVGMATRAPPPVPTRPTQQRSTLGYSSGMGGYGGGYGGYGGYGGGYGGLSGYGGGYGGYGGMYGSSYGGYGMNRFGMNDNTYDGSNSFARQAEESSRQAFQSIESIVHAVGSVSMMLESSFYAVYNSFRAVVGVADHFSRMKLAFAQIFSAFAVIRTLRWLYRRLLVLLRLRPAGYDEEVWSQAAEAGAAALGDSELKGQGRSSWPIMLFFAIIIGGPWLIWRLLASITGKKEGQEWYNGNDDHFRAVAEYDFQGDGDEELSFRRGQHITIAPKELQPRMRGWLLGSIDGKKQGILPANYVKVLGKRPGRRHQAKSSQALPSTQGNHGNTIPPTALPGSQGLPHGTSAADLEASFHTASSQQQSSRDLADVEFGCSENPGELGENLVMPATESTTAGVEEKTASEILEKNEG